MRMLKPGYECSRRHIGFVKSLARLDGNSEIRIERRPSRLDDGLSKAHVAVTSPGDYMALLSGDR